jgi:hypothetical protein
MLSRATLAGRSNAHAQGNIPSRSPKFQVYSNGSANG